MEKLIKTKRFSRSSPIFAGGCRCKFHSLENSWFVIVNPRAGGGKGERDWSTIERLLHENGISFSYRFTAHKHHAVELAVKAIEQGYRKLISVGGDGTLNEVVNGAFIQQHVAPRELTIGVIGVGTGNDWFRMYELPHSYHECIRAINKGKVFYQDIGLVHYYESNVRQKRYFVNAAGVGFDAEVAARTNRLKELGRKGTFLYILNLVRVLIAYRPTRINVNVNGYHIQDKIFSITIGICKYNGAGMMQVPYAISNDGQFDITVIKRVSKLNVLANIGRLYNGSILKHSRVSGIRGNSITVMSIPEAKLEADGESLGGTPLQFSIIREAIGVIVGENYRTDTPVFKPQKKEELILVG